MIIKNLSKMLDFCYWFDYKEFIIEYYFKIFFLLFLVCFILYIILLFKKIEDLFVLFLCYKDNGIYFFLFVKEIF